jgi:hypothetical protein
MDWDNFPHLRNGGYEETSAQTCLYNCIGWAAGDLENWWWPSQDSFWPLDSVDDESVENFEKAFNVALDYQVCENGDLEEGFEKVAIFARDRRVKHMARQIQTGVWSSKLGRGWDITHHAVDGVNCDVYGEPVSYMRRPRPVMA